MRLREIRETLEEAIQELHVQKTPLDKVIQGVQAHAVSNRRSIILAIERIAALDIFNTTDVTNTVVFRGGGDFFTEVEIQTFNHSVHGLKVEANRLLLVLKRAAPEPRAQTGFAIRLPPTRTLKDLRESVNALVFFSESVRLLGGELEFGGFDVGSSWIQVLSIVGDEAVHLAVGALIKAAIDYAQEKVVADKLFSDLTEKFGLTPPKEFGEAAEKQLQEYLTKALAEVCKSKGVTLPPEQKATAELGIRELSRIVEHGGEVRGLLTVNNEGATSRTLDPPVPQLEVRSTPLLTEGSKEAPPKSEPPPKRKKGD